MKGHDILRVFIIVAATAATGCEPRAAPSLDGTAAMVDTLAAINARVLADPKRNAFLNSARAQALQGMVASQRGQAALQFRYLLAQERLLAGQTREAIAELESLLAATGMQLDARTPQVKPIYDLLGIAWLRLGEQENCFNNPAANMCILPLSGAARHERQEGARKAIALYGRLLRAFPEDRGSQWLLNIAHLAVGEYPHGVPRQWRIPGLDVRRNPEFPIYPNIAGDVGLDIAGLSGGLSVEDFDRDGLLDLFFSSFGYADQVRLFTADGRGGYAERTEAAGLKGIVGGLNNTHADYDNDGFEDILVLRGAWLGDEGNYPMSLLRNRGDGTFEDVTIAAGLGTRHPRHSAAWGDFNLDGRLDLFVGNESAVATRGRSRPSELFVNEGDGTFRDVAAEVGIALDAFVKGVAWGDVNNDGLPDLFASVLNGRNRLFINRGGRSLASWTFDEARDAAGAALPTHSFPTWFWDVNQDGWEDLLVLSYDIRNSGALHDAVALEYLGLPTVTRSPTGTPLPVEPSRLYHNNGNGTFTDVTKAAGLEDKVIFAMGTNFGDLDNDGWFDFYIGTGNPDLRSVIPNRMFRGVGGTRFDEITLDGGFGHLQKGHAAAFVDLDQDGDEDIYMVMGGAYEGDRFTSILFENPGWPGAGWISLELEGRTANRSAIGARVELVVSDATGSTRTLYRTVGTGGSFGAGSLRLHIGAGSATGVRELRIRWPDAARSVTTHGNVVLGKSYRIVQGKEPVELQRPPVPFRRAAEGDAHRHR